MRHDVVAVHCMPVLKGRGAVRLVCSAAATVYSATSMSAGPRLNCLSTNRAALHDGRLPGLCS